MMNREEIVNRITPIAREVFGKPALQLTDELDATQVDTWTSFAFMQLLERVEAEFGFKFKMMELLGIRNIGTLVDAIAKH
jgi:acyl carrier protein